MTHARRVLSLTLSGLAGLVLTLAVTTCGGGSGSESSGTPTSPSASGSATNSGMVAGSGTCQYSATPTSFDFVSEEPFGTDSKFTGEIPVTVTGAAVGGERCTWWASTSSGMISIDGAMTGNGLIPPGDGKVTDVAGNGTLQFSLAHEKSLTNGDPDPTGGASCKQFDADDYSFMPGSPPFSYTGGTSPVIYVTAPPPATREGSITIREQGSNIKLFEIPITQTGSPCGWYFKDVNCDGPCLALGDYDSSSPASDWISIDGEIAEGVGPVTFGSGWGQYVVSAGDTPAGNPAPRKGALLLFDKTTALDKAVGMIPIEQLGDPAEDDPECVLSYSISQSEFGFPGGTAQLTVTTSDASCEWYADPKSSAEDWITVNDPTCGNSLCEGNHTVSLTVANGNTPPSQPTPRTGYVGLWKKVDATFEMELEIAISQTGGR